MTRRARTPVLPRANHQRDSTARAPGPPGDRMDCWPPHPEEEKGEGGEAGGRGSGAPSWP
jgi:hypothetical protein